MEDKTGLLSDDTLLAYDCAQGHKTLITWGVLKSKDHIHCGTVGCQNYTWAVSDSGGLVDFGHPGTIHQLINVENHWRIEPL